VVIPMLLHLWKQAAETAHLVAETIGYVFS
jgi:hypothetical protein